MSKTEIAQRLFARPQGATMDEVVAATGDYQYRALKRLKIKGYTIRTAKEGRMTRYWAVPPGTETFDARITADGKMTIPKQVRKRLDVHPGDQVRLAVEADDRVVLTPARLSVKRLRGILGKPPRSLTIEEMDEVVRRAVAAKHR